MSSSPPPLVVLGLAGAHDGRILALLDSRALEYLAAWAGYRNASVELGALCRATMGVVAPRSGIESAPTLGAAVDGHADTASPSVATHTAGRTAGHTAGHISGAEPAATRTSGAVPVAGLRVPPTGPMPIGARRPVRRRALLVGAGILAVGSSLGGIAVMAWLRGRSRDDRPDETDGAVARRTADGAEAVPAGAAGPARDVAAAAEPEPREPHAGAEAGQGSAAPVVGEREAASTDDGAPSDADSSTGATTDATGGDEATGEPDDAKAQTGTSPDPRPRKPSGKATVELRLRNPLRLAYARLGERGQGTIVNVSSFATIDPFPGFFAYAAAKAAVNLLALSASNEGRSHGVRAFAVAGQEAEVVLHVRAAARDALGVGQPIVQVEGSTEAAEGRLYFTTVRVLGGPGQRVTAFDLLGAALDPSQDVYDESRLFPPQSTRTQVQEENAAEMADSQQVAAAVAERAAGQEVGVHTEVTGVVDGAPASGVFDKGDVILAAMQSGKVGRFLVTKVDPCRDPADMFFATVKDDGYLDAEPR